MAEYIHTQSGARVSVADGKELGAGFVLVNAAPTGVRSEAPDKSWKVAELKAYADENDIDLGDATKKEDILAVIAGDDSSGDESHDDGSVDDAGE